MSFGIPVFKSLKLSNNSYKNIFVTFPGILRKVRQNKTLVQNFSYLSAMQIFSMLIPLITLPYLLKTLGKEIYGLIVFAQATISYLSILVNFGFNTFAVKEISVNRDNNITVSRIVSNILILKGTFFIVSLFILTVILFFIPQAHGYRSLFYLTMMMCIYDFIFPVWYFQGIERMKYITFLSLISRIIFLCSIFIFVKSKLHFLRVPFINGLGAMISGFIGLYIVFHSHKVKFVFSGLRDLIKTARDSFTFFISEVSIKVFASSSKVILGAAFGMAEVAYYDLAEKIVSIFKNVPLGVVRDTIFPKVVKTKNMRILRYTTLSMAAYSIFAVAFIYVFADQIINFFGAKEMLPGIPVLKLFAITIFTTHISNYYITIGLWTWGYENIYRNLMISSSALFLILILVLWVSGFLTIYTVVCLPILIDLYLIVCTFIICKRKNIL